MDGIGWLLDKRLTLCKFFGWSPEYVRTKITSAQGWTYYGFARENEVTMMGPIWQVKGDNYIAQHRKQLLTSLNK